VTNGKRDPRHGSDVGSISNAEGNFQLNAQVTHCAIDLSYGLTKAARRIDYPDLLHAMQALSQLS